MRTLHEAWLWYQAATGQLQLMQRLGRVHWDELPWDGRLGRDDDFRMLEKEEVIEETARGIEPLRDLGILVLFSVFESLIRRHVHAEVEKETATLKHPSLRHAATETLQQIDEGSFFRVLEPFKNTHAGLVEEVNQVRRYRNWVAHGRHENPPQAIVPADAFDRLQRFLVILGLTAGAAEGAGP